MYQNIIFFSLVCTLSITATGDCQRQEVRHMSVGGEASTFVELSRTNMAWQVPKLAQLGYITATINGDQVEFYQFDCVLVSKSMISLSADERRVVDDTLARFSSYNSGATQADAQVLGWCSELESTCQPIRQQVYTSDGESLLVAESGREFSISRANLFGQIVRIFVDSKSVSYVSASGQVRMTPNKCLDSADRKLINSLAAEVRLKLGKSSWLPG